MNRAERIFRLHQLFSRPRPVPLADLMAAVAGSRATVKRDLAYMRELMDAPVIYDRERNGYGYDPKAPRFELPGLWFNHSELYALLVCGQLLEAVHPGLLGPYLGPLKARIRQLLSQGGYGSDTVGSLILVRSMATRAVDKERFGQVAAALLNGMRLLLSYHGRERGRRTRRRVHPYRLIHYRDNWYLVAWCERAGALRTFSLDRINAAETLDGPVTPPDPAALDRFLNTAFGIFTGEARAWAVLRFSPHRARWVADEQWHTDQIGQWVGEHYQLQVPYSDPRELVMDILKYGPDVEVIAPPDLRELVAARLRAAAAVYSSPTDSSGR